MERPECRLECNAYLFLMFPAVMSAAAFAAGSPVTAELFKRLAGVGGLWLEVITLAWLTAWPALAVSLILIWGRIRRCWQRGEEKTNKHKRRTTKRWVTHQRRF